MESREGGRERRRAEGREGERAIGRYRRFPSLRYMTSLQFYFN